MSSARRSRRSACARSPPGARRAACMVGLGAAVERRAGGGGAGEPGWTDAGIGTGRAHREEDDEYEASRAVARSQSSRLARLTAGGVLGSYDAAARVSRFLTSADSNASRLPSLNQAIVFTDWSPLAWFPYRARSAATPSLMVSPEPSSAAMSM